MTERISAFFNDIRTMVAIAAALAAGGAGGIAIIGSSDIDAQQNGRLTALEASDYSQDRELQFLTCARVAELLPEASSQTATMCAAEYLRSRR